MKPIIPFALLGALFAVGAANAASTTPVGYTTQKIVAGQFSVLGLNVHQPVVSTGVLDAVDTDSVSDTGADFSALLTSGQTYLLEITNGTGNGVVQEVTSWSGEDLNLSVDLSTVVTGGTTTYTLRKAASVGDVFGADNAAGLQASVNADPAEADIIYIPDGSGGFTQIFYSTNPDLTGWLDTVNYADASATPIVYADGFLVERKGATTLDLVVTGEVKKTATLIAVDQAFSYVGATFPAGSTLGNSGLGSAVQASPNADPAEADVIYIPTGTGGFTQYFYSSNPDLTGWLDTVNYADSSNVELSAGILVERRSPSPYSVVLTPPASYESL